MLNKENTGASSNSLLCTGMKLASMETKDEQSRLMKHNLDIWFEIGLILYSLPNIYMF